jgi:NAD(P)-dependent dehydrogenase (short-subunit alcohol dehydrogenase family)
MQAFDGRTAVITGAGSGIGLELARAAARLGMRIVLADVEPDALDRAVREFTGRGVEVLPFRLDVSRADEVEALAAAVRSRFGPPQLVFNNAGVGAGGHIWEHSRQTWEWVVGVNLLGVAHGVRVFVPMMLEAAATDPAFEGHVVNTASMAGLVNPPNMGVYNVTKHAVVSLSETLFHDLALVTDRVHAHVLCPFFVPTAIRESERNRPESLREAGPRTRSQQVAGAMADAAVRGGTVSAAEVAELTFDAIRANRFYVYTHPDAMASVRVRLEDIIAARNPSDPLGGRPEVRAKLSAALKERR